MDDSTAPRVSHATSPTSTMAPSASPEPPASAAENTTSWIGVVSLGVGVFALVMAEFLPASLLSRIAADLGVTEGVAGQSVSVTAIVAAAAGITIPVMLPRMNRRHLMLSLSVLSVLSSLLVAVAPNYPVLLAARVLLGIAAGGFWAIGISLTARLVPPAKLGRGLTVVNIGVALATVAAIPLGTWLGELWGWRTVFVLAAAAGVVAVIMQSIVLPSVRSTATIGFGPLLATLRSRVIVFGLLAMGLVIAGHFAGFTYIRPAATAIGGLDAGQLAVLLVVYGVAAFLGNLAAGPLADKRLRLAVLLFPAAIGVAMLVFALVGTTAVGVILAVALWGIGFGAVPTATITWMARAEPTRLESVGGLQAAAFQVAIALGAIAGGLLVDGAGVQAAFIAGGISAVLGAIILVSIKS